MNRGLALARMRNTTKRATITTTRKLPQRAVARCWLAPRRFNPDEITWRMTRASTTDAVRPKPPKGSTPPRKQASTVMSRYASPCPTRTELNLVSITTPAIAHISPERV